jgi:hypothetical protein
MDLPAHRSDRSSLTTLPTVMLRFPTMIIKVENIGIYLTTLSFSDAPEPMDDDDFLLAQPSRLGIFYGIWEVYHFFLGLVSSLSFLTILVMKPWVESSLGKNLATDMVGQSLIWDQIDLKD